RAPIDFGEETLENAWMGLSRIYEAKARAVELARGSGARSDMRAETAWGSFLASCEQARKEIDECLANDFNTAGALGALFTLIREFNRVLSEPSASATPAAILAAGEVLKILEDDIGGVIGVGRHDAGKMLADIQKIRS